MYTVHSFVGYRVFPQSNFYIAIFFSIISCFSFIVITLNVKVIRLQQRENTKRNTNIHDKPKFELEISRSWGRELNHLSQRIINKYKNLHFLIKSDFWIRSTDEILELLVHKHFLACKDICGLELSLEFTATGKHWISSPERLVS